MSAARWVYEDGDELEHFRTRWEAVEHALAILGAEIYREDRAESNQAEQEATR